VDAQDDLGCTALMCELLEHGARPKIDDQNYRGAPPLIYASGAGHQNVVDLLIKENAKVNVQANDGHTALMVAALKGRLDVVVDLLNVGADATLVNENGQSAFDFAQYYAKE